MEERKSCDVASLLKLPFEPEPQSESLLLPAPLPVGQSAGITSSSDTV